MAVPQTHRNFAIIDAAMNDLIRPALYEAWMEPVVTHRYRRKTWDLVGAICETGDFIGRSFIGFKRK